MKTDFLHRALKTAFIVTACFSFLACKESVPELDFTPEQIENEAINVSEELTRFTLSYDEEKTQDLDAAIERVRKMEFVENVIKASDHIRVTYKDGMTIYYPFIVPSAFSEENASLSSLASQMEEVLPDTRTIPNFKKGGMEIFDFNSNDPTRAVQKSMLRVGGKIINDEFDFVNPYTGFSDYYHGHEMVTVSNIERAIANNDNDIVVIATHGIEDGVITSETLEYEALGRTPGFIPADIGTVNSAGKRVYNRVWRPTQYHGGWMSDMVYFTGCGIFTPAVCRGIESNFSRESYTRSLIVGWDGKNNIAEALFLVMADCFRQGLSFFDYYKQEGANEQSPLFGSASKMVYTGSKQDFKPSSKSFHLPSRSSYLISPDSFCQLTNNNFYQVRSKLDEDWEKTGRFKCFVYDFLRSEQKVCSAFTRVTIDWLEQVLTSSDYSVTFFLRDPGVYNVVLCYLENGEEILVDEKYIIKKNGFKLNGGEEPLPDIKVATVVTESADCLYGCQMTVCPDDLTQFGFKVWEKDDPSQMLDVQGTPHDENNHLFQALLNGLQTGTTYQAKAYVKYVTGNDYTGNVVEFTVKSTENPEEVIPDAVDLGLPSGIKWASFNLGATRPEEFGDYYAWGETEPYYQPGYAQSSTPLWKPGKEDGYWNTSYKWIREQMDGEFNGSSTYKYTKYCTEAEYGYYGFKDGKTVLDPEDDAAHVHLGGKWRMPTVEERNELYEMCTWKWTSVNGIDGYQVSGSNGNSIFIPIAGYRLDSRFVTTVGNYWTSSLEPKYSEATAFCFGFHDESTNIWDEKYRIYGLTIRPVYVK